MDTRRRPTGSRNLVRHTPVRPDVAHRARAPRQHSWQQPPCATGRQACGTRGGGQGAQQADGRRAQGARRLACVARREALQRRVRAGERARIRAGSALRTAASGAIPLGVEEGGAATQPHSLEGVTALLREWPHVRGPMHFALIAEQAGAEGDARGTARDERIGNAGMIEGTPNGTSLPCRCAMRPERDVWAL